MALKSSELMSRFNLKEGSYARWHGLTPQGKPYTLTMQNNAWQVLIPVTLKYSEEDKQWRSEFKKLQFTISFPKSMIILMSTKTSHFEDRLEAALNLIDRHDFVVNEICPICQKGNCDSLGIAKGNFSPTHQSCVRRLEQEKSEELEVNEGNYLTGAIGAFLGALAIALLGLVPIMLVQRSYGIIFACSGVAAVWGYKKLKGKLGMASKIIIAVMSLIAFIFFLHCFAYISICIYLESAVSIGLFFDLLPELTTVIFSIDFLSSCWFEILFFVGGLAYACFMDRSLNPKHILGELEKDTAILQPMPYSNKQESTKDEETSSI